MVSSSFIKKALLTILVLILINLTTILLANHFMVNGYIPFVITYSIVGALSLWVYNLPTLVLERSKYERRRFT